MQLVQSVGVAVACLFGLGGAVWAALRWAAQNVLQPLVQRHMAHLDAVDTRLGEMASALTQITATQCCQQEQLEHLAASVDRLQRREEATAKLNSSR